MDTEGKFGYFSCLSLSASNNRKNKRVQCTRCVCVCVRLCEAGKLHATTASTNSTVKQRHLSRMLKALRAEASVTSIASGCQRWLKTWEQASVLKILCVGVCVLSLGAAKVTFEGHFTEAGGCQGSSVSPKEPLSVIGKLSPFGGRYGRGSRLTGRN